MRIELHLKLRLTGAIIIPGKSLPLKLYSILWSFPQFTHSVMSMSLRGFQSKQISNPSSKMTCQKKTAFVAVLEKEFNQL
jgi:hypothetical protein